MGSTSPFKDHRYNNHNHQSHFVTKKLIPWTLYALLPIALLRLFFNPLDFLLSSSDHLLPTTSPISISSSSSSISISNPPPLIPPHRHQEGEKARHESAPPCDYTTGKWVQDKRGPIYNATTCKTIKEGQNCFAHGRPDSDYLYWRWEPNQSHCQIPRFDPNTFLQLISNKHLAFVGDSLARNQLESLLCMLATLSPPNLVYTGGEDNKFRRWNFPSHNVSISVYWSPFLVQGVEKSSSGPSHNHLFLDRVDQKWAEDLDKMDMIVLSFGHWYLNPGVFFEGDLVLGCHYCPGLNHTEIGFYDAVRKALRTTLNAIRERRRVANGKGISVVVTTFSPAHFVGEWDKNGACSKTKPFGEGEKMLEGMDAEMRKVQVEEVEMANQEENGERHLVYFRAVTLDVTKLALMRPDGHPGPYMHPFPFAHGVGERVQNDCVHWCLPGPIDTWNEILLEVIKKWDLGQSGREE